jgi:hypothetical protein
MLDLISLLQAIRGALERPGTCASGMIGNDDGRFAEVVGLIALGKLVTHPGDRIRPPRR